MYFVVLLIILEEYYDLLSNKKIIGERQTR